MLRKDQNIFIVYKHLNPLNDSIFYIGIGVIGREKQKCKRSIRWKNYVNKYGFISIVIYSGLTWSEACVKEKYLIKEVGRLDNGDGPLINMTDGGDGTGGYEGYWKGKKRNSPTEEARNKMRENNCKYWAGKSISQETRDKIRKKLIGRKHTKETRAKYKNRIPWNKGKECNLASDETKIKMSLSQKLRWAKRKEIAG